MVKLRWFFIIPWFDLIWLFSRAGVWVGLAWLGLADAITVFLVFLCGLCRRNAPSKSYGHNRKVINLVPQHIQLCLEEVPYLAFCEFKALCC
jgi:hypothetical protein